jgi:Divergent InlB B-repeat domain/Collagen triple helix repeat (20 copies)
MLVACALAAAATLGATSAGAEVTHPFLTSITEANGEPLVQPWGMVVDSSGNLLLADARKRVIDKFDATNSLTSQFPTGKLPAFFVRSVAVDNATGDVYVGESGEEEVFVFKPKGGGEYELIQQFKVGGYVYVAVDNSNSARKGDVYVISAQELTKVHVYTPTAEGKLESKGSTTLTPPGAEFSLVNGDGWGAIAVDDSTGDVYLAEPPNKVIDKYGPDGNLIEQLHGTGTPAGSFEPLGIAFDEANGHVLVLDTAHEVVDEFSGTWEYEGQIKGAGGSEPFTAARGVAVRNAAGPTQGQVFVSDGAVVDIFGPSGGGGTSEFPLTVAKTGSGSGTVTSSPSGIDCGETCTAEFEEGAEVTLSATPAAGSTFAGWSGACTGTGECKVTLAAAQEVKAEFTLTPSFSVSLEKIGEGSGTVTSAPAAIDCGAECSAEFSEGAKVTLTAAAAGGSKFVEWSGEECAGSTAAKCEFTVPSHAVAVKAEFAQSTTVPLRVVKYGQGTVVSSPPGIDCAAACFTESAELEPGSVTLTETPAAGYEFAGWIGCKATALTTCEVTLSVPTEVMAIFLKAGNEGKAGPQGPAGGEGEEGKEGKEGKVGPSGPAGATGSTGATGAAGTAGQKGADGATGPAGAAGPVGPAGAAGPQGPAGADGKVQFVKCVTVKQGNKKVQKCTTKLVSGPLTLKAAAASAHATLSRRGVVYAAGIARTIRGRLSLRLRSSRRLRPGGYTLTLVTGHGRFRRVRTQSFVLG